ncbi:hypothetical protein [Reichenbachiella sp. MALMAid0571]|uniref:hypothetical protein n=1 Tax=Reichenbachiella sp. MALMAid0571 TaxID=3143939 RepID=UPI0032E0282A
MKTTTKFPKMVERMREIRDEVSHDIMNMSLEEEKAYIADQLNKLKIKRSMASDSVNSPK